MDKIIIAASTHWDREWYRTFQDFQIRLCDLMNQLLDLLEKDQDFLCYTFDGQSVVLEDYLEIYPENKQRIQRLVKKGKIVFGPLYNLPDEFLSGGEGLVRNFLIGNQVCKDIGGKMNVGYVPDNFGHISQLPQILQGVGIDNAFFFRGTNAETIGAKEFYWESPDGSCVLAEYMLLGYWSLKSWGKLDKNVKEHFQSAYTVLKEHSRLNTFLLINGSDHLYQDPNFTKMLKEVRDAFPEMLIENGSIEDYARLAREAAALNTALPHIAGELRDFRYGPDPTAATSSHSYIKRLLFYTLAEVERYAEPMAVIRASIDQNYFYPQGFFTKIWKKILISLGHDGTSGCSTDEVMRDIESYLVHAKETVSRISDLAIEGLADGMFFDTGLEDTHFLAVFNPHPFAYSGITKQVIHLEIGEMRYKDFILYDEEGTRVPYEILNQWEDIITREFPYNSKKKIYRTCFEILFRADNVPSLGMKTWRIHKSQLLEKREAEFYVRCCNSNNWIENEFYKITVNQDASIDIYDKKENRWYKNLNTYVCRREAGDEYQHVSPLRDRHVFAVLQGVSVVENSSLSKTMQITAQIEVPLEAKSRKEKQYTFVRTDIALYGNTNRIEFHVEMENTESDYIFFTKFPCTFKNAKDYSYISFDEVERENKIYKFNSYLKSTQSLLKPMQKYAGVRGDDGSFHIMTKGIYEYHTKRTQEGLDFYLTLLRSTSYLFRGLPISWLDGQESTTPIVETKRSQEKGMVSADYAICLNQDKEQVSHMAEIYEYPLRGTDTFQGGIGGRQSKKFSFLEIDDKELRISALKQSEDGTGVVIRLYNTKETLIRCKMRTMLPIRACSYCNLLEEKDRKAVFSQYAIELNVDAKKIVTLKIQWE